MTDKELRAPKKHYFQLEYATVETTLELLDSSELSEWFNDIAHYELYGDEPASFSNRAVQMAYNMTVRELDYQLEKHFARQARGGKNYRDGMKRSQEQRDGYTNLDKALTAEQRNSLAERYPIDFGDLMMAVQRQVKDNHTIVDNPYSYIIAYAESLHWNDNHKDYDISSDDIV